MVKVGNPSAIGVPRTQANLELLLLASSPKHAAPVFLEQVLTKLQFRNPPQQRSEPIRAAHSHNVTAVL